MEDSYQDITLIGDAEGNWRVEYINLNGIADGLSLDSDNEDDALFEAAAHCECDEDEITVEYE